MKTLGLLLFGLAALLPPRLAAQVCTSPASELVAPAEVAQNYPGQLPSGYPGGFTSSYPGTFPSTYPGTSPPTYPGQYPGRPPEGGVPCSSGANCPGYVIDESYDSRFDQCLHEFRKLADGRPVLLAMVDNKFTRTLAVYGGFEKFNSSNGDIFDGAHGLDDAYTVGILQGRRHSTYLRSVFDFTYHTGKFPNSSSPGGDIDVYTIMKNIYVDLNNPCEHRTTPY
ncbi:MAG: hypothetical protein AAGF97_05680, partial [Planctomycetota bacterium]